MPNTYTQLYIQIVFTVKGKQNLIPKSKQEELFKYISGIISNKGHKSIIVNGMSDHIHLFVGLKPSISISELARDVKNNSSKFINKSGWLKNNFSWQEGFGAFSYSNSQIDKVYNYILNQEKHHQEKTFKKEYTELLDEFDVDYLEKYLFDWIE